MEGLTQEQAIQFLQEKQKVGDEMEDVSEGFLNGDIPLDKASEQIIILHEKLKTFLKLLKT